VTGPDPLGVVLAGGAGRRLGGAKPSARLRGRPLTAWVGESLAAVCGKVVVVAKAATPLPRLAAGVEVWREPDEPVHPLAGIVWALQRARGRAVLVCPVDVPFVTEASLRRLLAAPGEVAVAQGQPLLGRFGPAALGALQAAVADGWPARVAIGTLDPTVVEVPEPELFNVNTIGDLAAAEGMAERR
jgi:molybdopterin-guanine dinucleotide biosynthesis protein A